MAIFRDGDIDSGGTTVIGGGGGGGSAVTIIATGAGSIGLYDIVYISGTNAVTKAGSDTTEEGQGMVTNVISPGVFEVTFGVFEVSGLSTLGYAGGDRLYLDATTATPNLLDGLPPSGSVQEIGMMLDNDRAIIMVDRTEVG